MSGSNNTNTNDELLDKIRKIVEDNLHNELFGVSELAASLGMNRSYLHRKINALTKTSVSQFIRQTRLRHAREMLRQTSLTVSEVAYKVGFSSVTYFNKCFHDYYGYPPGKVGNRDEKEEANSSLKVKKNIVYTALIFLIVVISVVIFVKITGTQNSNEISVAVLIWDDSSPEKDKFVISGINDYVRSGLCAVNYLTVTARRAVMRYEGDTQISIKKIGKDLGVDYILAASGHTDDKIVLTVYLNNAKTGDVKWSDTFYKDREEVISFQPELTKKIINLGLEITLSKEEKRKIENVVTNDLEANKYYSKGLYNLNLAQCNYMCNHQNPELNKFLIEAKDNLEIALNYDSLLAPAYAYLAKIYYFLGASKERFDSLLVFRDLIRVNAEKAYKIDFNSEEACIAKAYSCWLEKDFEKAIDYLNEALTINPNSAEAMGRMVNIYGFNLRWADKFAEYALKNLKINNGVTEDDFTRSTIYFCTALALSRTGFFKEAEPYYIKTLEVAPNHAAAFTQKTFDMVYSNFERKDKAIDYFVTNYPHNGYDRGYDLDYFEDLGYLYYLIGDYENAYKNFNIQIEKYGDIGREKYVLIYYHTLKKLNKDVEINKCKETCLLRLNEYGNPRFKDYILSAWYCITEDKEKAREHLKQVTQMGKGIPSYNIIFELYYSPMFENLRDDIEFAKMCEEIDNQFWEIHEKTEKYLIKNNETKNKSTPFKWIQYLIASV